MKLLLIRHAIAEYQGASVPDENRALSSQGKKIFHELCKQIQFLNLHFDLLLTSPLLRSKETADIFSIYTSITKTEVTEELKPSANPELFMVKLAATGLKSIAVVGHQPFLNQFISLCFSVDKREFVIQKRGSLLFLEFPLIVKEHSAILKCFLDPNYLIQKDF